MGDNQLGVEVMGHSYNDRTRYSVALLSSNDGTTQLPYGSESYSTFITGSQAFDAGRLGVQRLGFYVMAGEAPTSWLTNNGVPIPGSGTENKGYSREGFVGQFYFGQHLDLQVVTQHGEDSAWFGQGYGDLIDGVATLNNTPGARASRWLAQPDLERRALRASLCSESTDDFDRPLRNDSYVSAVDSWKPFKCWQYFDLHDRIPLQPVYDEQSRLCLPWRVQLVSLGWSIAGY